MAHKLTEQEAIQKLSKLLSAARTAQANGKELALSRIIQGANKISAYLNKHIAQFEAQEEHVYRPVTGEIIE